MRYEWSTLFWLTLHESNEHKMKVDLGVCQAAFLGFIGAWSIFCVFCDCRFAEGGRLVNNNSNNKRFIMHISFVLVVIL